MAHHQTSWSVNHAAIAEPSLGITPRTAGAIFTNTVAYARTALAMGAISLLMLIAMACGNEGNQTTPAQSELTDQRTPSRTRTLTSLGPEVTATVVSSSRPEATVPTTQSSAVADASTTATSRPGDSTEPPPTAVALSPELAQEAQAHYEVAEFYLKQGRYHRALQRLDQAIAINPDLAEAYTLRGLAHTVLRDYDSALEDLTTAIDQGADNMGRAYAFRSYAHSELGNFDQAMDVEKAPIEQDDLAARQDAKVALFIASYRMGDYGSYAIKSVRYEGLPGREPGYYSLGRLYTYAGDVASYLDTIQEIDASLLLQPNDAELHQRRGTAHQRMQWHAKAAEDFTKALELYGNNAPQNLHIALAESYLALGEYEQVIETLSQVDIGTNAAASSLLAYTYLRLGRPEDAKRSIDAIDYGFDAPTPGGRSGLEYWSEEIRYNANRVNTIYGTHLVLKGAIYAANGDYDEGVRYLNILECANKSWVGSRSQEIPIATKQQRDKVLQNYRKEYESSRLIALRSQQEVSQWCGYPDEFIANPDSAVWLTVLTEEKIGDHFLTIGNGLVSTPSRDPLVIGSDNVGMLRYMTDLYAMNHNHSFETLETTERIIKLDPSIADAYRIQAELYLTYQRYERAVAAWEQYEALTTPEPEVAADHHFARGATLAQLMRKEEAQSAYQKAFELGYDQDKVQKALIQLNQ